MEDIMKIHILPITTKGKLKVLQEKERFCLVLISKEPTMLKKIIGTKINFFFFCASHMTICLSIFISFDKSIQPKVKVKNGKIVQAKGNKG
ncbi:hypothetical protein CR513_61498, partial [Mucuna pruriens]